MEKIYKKFTELQEEEEENVNERKGEENQVKLIYLS